MSELTIYMDDDSKRRSNLGRHLQKLGLSVEITADADTAKKAVAEPCTLIIASSKSAKDLCELFLIARSSNQYAILIGLLNKINLRLEEKLFDSGANDVVVGIETTPKVFLKRIKAHLKFAMPKIPRVNLVKLGSTIIDFDKRQTRCNGVTSKMPGMLPELLKYFLDNPNRIISRDELRDSPLWTDSICSSAEEGGKTFDVNVGKLRKLIEPDPSCPKFIRSVRGQGWILDIEKIEHQ